MVKTLRIAFWFGLWCGIGASVLAAAGPQAVVLMYHRFGEPRYPSTNIRLEQFEAQLQYLAQNNFTVVPLADIVDALPNNTPLPDRTVAITIDDAYRSVYENAFPRLKHYGWPFTVFVSTQAVDQKHPSQMTWDQMRAMRPWGVTFANHGARHLHLLQRMPGEAIDAYRGRISKEVMDAQARLQEELGPCPQWFSYPYGEFDTEIAELVRLMGYIGFGQQSGAIGPHSDPRILPRFAINEDYGGLDEFMVRVQSFPLPVASCRPWDPVTVDRRPVLEVTLRPDTAVSLQVQGFVSGQGRVRIEWLEAGRRFRMQAPADLPRGSRRYNITAPSREPGRFYWFSHQWIVQ